MLEDLKNLLLESDQKLQEFDGNDYYWRDAVSILIDELDELIEDEDEEEIFEIFEYLMEATRKFLTAHSSSSAREYSNSRPYSSSSREYSNSRPYSSPTVYEPTWSEEGSGDEMPWSESDSRSYSSSRFNQGYDQMRELRELAENTLLKSEKILGNIHETGTLNRRTRNMLEDLKNLLLESDQKLQEFDGNDYYWRDAVSILIDELDELIEDEDEEEIFEIFEYLMEATRKFLTAHSSSSAREYSNSRPYSSPSREYSNSRPYSSSSREYSNSRPYSSSSREYSNSRPYSSSSREYSDSRFYSSSRGFDQIRELRELAENTILKSEKILGNIHETGTLNRRTRNMLEDLKNLLLESDQKLQEFDGNDYNWSDEVSAIIDEVFINDNYYDELDELIEDGDEEEIYEIFHNLMDAAEYFLDATE